MVVSLASIDKGCNYRPNGADDGRDDRRIRNEFGRILQNPTRSVSLKLTSSACRSYSAALLMLEGLVRTLFNHRGHGGSRRKIPTLTSQSARR